MKATTRHTMTVAQAAELNLLMDMIQVNYGHLDWLTLDHEDFELIDGEWTIDGTDPHDWLRSMMED